MLFFSFFFVYTHTHSSYQDKILLKTAFEAGGLAAKLTWSRVGYGGCRHGDGNANTAAAAVLPAAATPAASTEGGERETEEKDSALCKATCEDCTAGNTADGWTLC